MVATVEEALALRGAETGAICVGEVRGEAPDGFDYGNSPFEIATVDLRGKTIIQRTSAGTQGIVAASARADRLYAASLVTAEATVRALLVGSPCEVTIVAMGDNGIIRTDEDELTAIHLRNLLEGRPGNKQAVRQVILAGGEVGRFYDPARLGHRPEDVEIALDIDRYDFAIRVECQNERPIARLERLRDLRRVPLGTHKSPLGMAKGEADENRPKRSATAEGRLRSKVRQAMTAGV